MSIPGQCKNATQVKLLTYQALPASCLLPECEFQRHLTNGVSVAHLADLVRLRALKAHGGGWFLDCNTVWVKAAPDSVTFELGHCVGSLHAARRRGSAEAVKRYWMVNYLTQQGDQAYLASPLLSRVTWPAIGFSTYLRNKRFFCAWNAEASGVWLTRGYGGFRVWCIPFSSPESPSFTCKRSQGALFPALG